jgi:hypothetical protein
MGDDNAYLRFDGSRTYIEIPSSADFSIATTGELTVSAWIRPTALVFPRTEGRNGSRYIHWFGKGATGEQEWTFRMYSQDTADGRMNRISFYVFNWWDDVPRAWGRYESYRMTCPRDTGPAVPTGAGAA